MEKGLTPDHSAVRRLGAERYLRRTLIWFALTVIAVRLALAATGYPKLGGGELHIAHVLWGGLFLFGAALSPLLFANRWALGTSAVLAGIGVGLFIDEVGKFLTQTNDYFFPPAAPIIYAVFLLTLLLYLRVREEPARTVRHDLYAALDNLPHFLDHDLDARRYAELCDHLRDARGTPRTASSRSWRARCSRRSNPSTSNRRAARVAGVSAGSTGCARSRQAG